MTSLHNTDYFDLFTKPRELDFVSDETTHSPHFFSLHHYLRIRRLRLRDSKRQHHYNFTTRRQTMQHRIKKTNNN